MKWPDDLDTGGGHIMAALFVFLIGVGLVFWHPDVGKEIIVGSLASLWTVLKMQPPQRGR